MKVKWLSHVRLFETPWAAAHQAPLSVGFSRQEYWSGVPLPSLHTIGFLLISLVLPLPAQCWQFVLQPSEQFGVP